MQHTSFPAPATTDTGTIALSQQVLHFFEQVLLPSSQKAKNGHLQLSHLLLTCLLMLLRQTFSPPAIQHALMTETVGPFAALASISRQAVRQRLMAIGITPFTQLLQRVQQALPQREVVNTTLAPFAPMVVALDETKLSDIARLAERSALLPKEHLMVGKLSALFDLRLQRWVHLQFLSDPLAHGAVASLLLIEHLPKASLIVADLGYFGYAWFRFLSDQGYFWISRLKDKSCYQIMHTFYQKGETLDALIWLGIYRSNQYPHMVRLVQYRQGTQLYRYISNVTDPLQLPFADIVSLYARRWDIEMAFKVLKRTLGLHLWWACERVLVLQQLLLTLMIAQVIHAIQGEIAAEADVDPQEVSLVVLRSLFPHANWPTPFGMVAALVIKARVLGLIRPSRYLKLDIPLILESEIQPVSPDLVRERAWKRTVRKDPRHPRCTDPSDFLFFPLALL